jgi:ATP-binding cassette subfamily B protein
MYDPTSGHILLDGHPLQEYDLVNLRQSIAYVPQDVFLFSDTIESNIKFGTSGATQSEMESYARQAAIHDDIASLSEGYLTRVGERGITLSGGQKQRVSIARAMIRKPQLVILDDCLSAVDTHTEHTIVRFLNEQLDQKTAIIITHRIVGMLEYDKILVLDQGRLVEEGTHDDLMLKQGFYYDLWQQQLVDSVEEGTF